jgi:hypothetical protein
MRIEGFQNAINGPAQMSGNFTRQQAMAREGVRVSVGSR